MLFLNEYEIDEAVRIFAEYAPDDSVLNAAARTLSNLRYAVNANSDGWPYWSAPSKAAQKLQELIRDGLAAVRQGKTLQGSHDRYRAAQTPLKSFRTRNGVDFEIVQVP